MANKRPHFRIIITNPYRLSCGHTGEIDTERTKGIVLGAQVRCRYCDNLQRLVWMAFPEKPRVSREVERLGRAIRQAGRATKDVPTEGRV